MNVLGRFLSGRWTVSTVAGLLIVAALVAGRLADADGLSKVLMVVAAAIAGLPILRKAVHAAMVRVVGIDLLVSVAAIGAIVIGEYWEAAAVTFLFAVGHSLESATLNKTRSALAELIAVAPDVAVVMRDGAQVEVPAGEVITGETVLVKNGAKVPVDGVVAAGTAALDEASITGESIPVEKVTGDKVFAGTVSRGGFLQVTTTGVGADTTLARIIHRVEEAQDAKARTQQFMDKFSAWYTPAIIVLSLVVGLLTGNVVLALTLLVIGCPGALVISIPVSIVAGIGRAAKDGVLVKGGEFLETAAKISVVAVDKTGTLTMGRPHLTDVVVLDPTMDRVDVLDWAARAEAGSEHPLARPILQAGLDEGLGHPSLPEQTEPVVGKGIVTTTGGCRVLVGNAALLQEYDVPAGTAGQVADELASAGRTPLIVAVDDTVIGVVAVADEVRPEAAAMVAELHAIGVHKVVMLTGDVAAVGQSVGRTVGVDEVYAGLLPEDKMAAIADLQRQGHVVAMVGDGVNDAPALALADIGVAMGAAGSAVAVETADIALMGDNLHKLPEAIDLARRTANNMRQNITVALVTVGFLVAGVLFGGVTMAIGMLVHQVSVLVVIVNAMRLLRRRNSASTGISGRVHPVVNEQIISRTTTGATN